MKLIKLELFAGENINNVANKAKDQAIKDNVIVEFDFNGILCKVSSQTEVKYLIRDYHNAHLMEWSVIGDVCWSEYPNYLKSKIKEKQKEQEEESKIRAEEYSKKNRDDKKAFQKLIKGIEFKVKDEKVFNGWKAKNKDGYSAVIFEYAEDWGRMLQTKIGSSDIKDLIDDFSLQPNYLGITGFQHGAAMQVLEHCWIYGSELKTK